MKYKINLKILFFTLAIFFLILTIFLIRNTYARYITSLATTSYVEMGSWLIRVNNQNIIQNSDISDVVTPIFDSNPQYIADGTVSPTSTGYVEITIDYQDVTVPFKYEISCNYDDSTVLNDFKLTGYSVDGGTTISLDDSNAIVTDTVLPEETTRTRTLKLNFVWYDGENEVFDDIEDTAFSHNVDELGLRFNIEFIQLQPTT